MIELAVMPSELSLKELTISDKDAISPYLYLNKYGVCDFSFSNIYIWRHTYKVEYSLHRNFLIILSSDFDGLRHFFMPLSLADSDPKEIIDDMIAWSFEKDEDFRMIGLTDSMLDELSFLGPNFIVEKSEIWDYIYNAEDLIHLKGKKFHAKRNHINKFNSLYNYQYSDLQKEHIPLCLDLLKAWNLDNGNNALMTADERAVIEALNNFEELGMSGGCLFIDGKLGAFTMGQPINSEIYAIHIEKALPEYEGIYSKINQAFAERHCSGYKYINREEDLGIEGLRKSKMSYNPSFLLHKRVGTLSYDKSRK